VMTMMAKRPEDRYQTPGEVAAALRHWTEEPIAPPSPDELPVNPLAGGIGAGSTVTNAVTGSGPKLAPRPSRGMMTERMTESAIRRMDGLPNPDDEPAGGRRRYVLAGVLLLVAVGGIVLAVAKPWEDRKPAAKDDVVLNDPDDLPPKFDPTPPGKGAWQPPPPQPKTAPLGAGLVVVHMDNRTARPAPRNGGVRATPTDLLFFTGPDLRRSERDEGPMLDVLRKDVAGGKGGPGSPDEPIIPYAVAADGSAVPNTLLSVDPKGGLRPLALNPKDYFATANFSDAKPEFNALVRGNATLPKGLTAVNALASEFWDFSAAKEGSTLRVNSGAVLFAGTTSQRSFVFGAGDGPLTLDFNGRAGFLTVSTDQDFERVPGRREYVVRAGLVNFGNNPLVVSGLSGAVLRMSPTTAENPQLVVQGARLVQKDKAFRIFFDTDAQLGRPGGPVKLDDAALAFTRPETLDLDRPLHLQRVGEIAATDGKGQLRWHGKIGGGALVVWGGGAVVLDRRDNDFGGGTEIWGGTLVLRADGGTPAGTGHVNVHFGTLAGAGTVLKDLNVKANATLQPGDDGKPLVCNGRLTFERQVGKDKNGKAFDRSPRARFVLPRPDARPLIYAGPPPLDLAGANLEIVLAGDNKPAPDAKCFLITNRPGVKVQGTFRNVPPNTSVKTADGKWTAKISYEGNADRGTVGGGADVVLYDFAPTGK
jgi:autotransporter-associated beta strand protein